MSRRTIHRTTTLLLAAVWIGFGLYAKVLDQVPRHEEIVARILGPAFAAPITHAIGGLEVGLGLWVASAYRGRLCAVVQMALVATMNALELWLAPDLLLWGALNGIAAAALVGVIYVNEWVLGEPSGG